MSLGFKGELDSRYARSLISGSPRSTFGRDILLDWTGSERPSCDLRRQQLICALNEARHLHRHCSGHFDTSLLAILLLCIVQSLRFQAKPRKAGGCGASPFLIPDYRWGLPCVLQRKSCLSCRCNRCIPCNAAGLARHSSDFQSESDVNVHRSFDCDQSSAARQRLP
jgi:hypothetical protein